MDYSNVLDYKVKELVDLIITDGVEPADIVNNIFDKEYSRMNYYKKDEHIIGEIEFYEDNSLVKMIYTYSEEKRILKIEEQQGKETVILWDREDREKEIIGEIIYFMKSNYTHEQIIAFIDSLPSQIKFNIQTEFSRIA